jgi:uncharacterized membrane protein YsdA (DUF1294 family)
MSLITFYLFGIDKKRAIRKRRRISETQLLVFSFLGGIIGAITGMFVFRHKLSKPAFMSKFYGVLVVHVMVIVFMIYTIYFA